ncbi:hypothetical protein QZH41_011457, partial [Actinostola sp. cb2023]
EKKKKILMRYWESGMTSTSNEKDKPINKAAKEANLSSKTVKSVKVNDAIINFQEWIGNERKRQGMSRKRSAKTKSAGDTVPCKTRRTSAYQLFKSDFLKSDLAKTLMKTNGKGEAQRRANALWTTVGAGEKEAYEQKASDINANPIEAKHETKKSRIKKLTGIIRDSIDQLDTLGCPSLWVGNIGGIPERYFATGVGQLANDETFINYTVSSMISSVGKSKQNMELAKTVQLPAKQKKRKKSAQKKQKETSDPRFHLTDVNGKLVATGQKVPQTTVHGRKLTSEWAAFQVTMVVDTNAKPWDAYPTHSGQVEQGSFVAWPLANAKQVEPASMRKREATSLIDGLHPDFGRGSPSALVNQPRQSRLKSKK